MGLAIELPAGRFAAAVSGGADSVAMLYLTFGAVGHVIHVDHQLRGHESDADAAFVVGLCRRLGVPCTVVRRADVPAMASAGSPAELRAMRLAIYLNVVDTHRLDGVLLAHHADDQAETVCLRLLRGSSFEGIGGMPCDAIVGGVRLVRPLLGVRAWDLREYLRNTGQAWRDDSSNLSDRYGRNRVRRALAERPGLAEALLELARASRNYRHALEAVSQRLALGDELRIGELDAHPPGRSAGRRWLTQRLGPDAVTPAVVERFILWCGDASGPSRLSLPGDVLAVRSRGTIRLQRLPPTAP